jgi:hypothetical protein
VGGREIRAAGRFAMEHFCAMLRHRITMKTSRVLLSTLFALAPVVATQAAPAEAMAGRVSVNFFEPEKFRDVGSNYQPSDRDRDHDLAQIREYLVTQASRMLPEGQRLEVTFTDIDRAGEFEPWRGPRYMDVRIIKDIYTPRMSLSFRVTDSDGNVVKEGKRALSDLSFNQKLVIDRNDTYRFEKELLNDWLRAEFPRESKS